MFLCQSLRYFILFLFFYIKHCIPQTDIVDMDIFLSPLLHTEEYIYVLCFPGID